MTYGKGSTVWDFSKQPHIVTGEFTKLMMDSFPSDLFEEVFKKKVYQMLMDVIKHAKKDGYDWDDISISLALRDKMDLVIR